MKHCLEICIIAHVYTVTMFCPLHLHAKVDCFVGGLTLYTLASAVSLFTLQHLCLQ